MNVTQLAAGFAIGAALATLNIWSQGRRHRRRMLLVLLFQNSYVLDSMSRFGIEYPYLVAKRLRDDGLIDGNQCVSLTELGRAHALRLL